MNRLQLLAAEIFSYSFDNYASHLGFGHLRFEKLMPEMAASLEQAEKEAWPDQRLARTINVALAEVPEWRQRYRNAVEVVDAPSPAEAFRAAVRQSLATELEHHHLGDAEQEAVVKQICYRAADLSYLLHRKGTRLEEYSEELRRED